MTVTPRTGRARGHEDMDHDPFGTHRRLLFTVAYEMLGSAADAEDVVQETWLRWADVDHDEVLDPRAYLVRIATRQALNRLRTLRRRREDYVGSWLPEPVLTSPDVAEDVELAESVSVAMLTVLETLSPTERAAFVLREIFATPYDEIAAVLDRSPAAVRQIVHRARERVAARRPRMEVDASEQRAVVERFLAATHTGDVQALLAVLAPEVVAVADGGGHVPAVRQPVTGAERVARLLAGLTKAMPVFGSEIIWLNGATAIRLHVDGETHAVVSLVVADGRVTHLYAVNNPHKLRRLAEPEHLSR